MESIGTVSFLAGGTCRKQQAVLLSSGKLQREALASFYKVFPQRGSLPSLETKQIHIDNAWHFFRKRGKQFSNVVGDHLWYTSQGGWCGRREVYQWGKQEEYPQFHH